MAYRRFGLILLIIACGVLKAEKDNNERVEEELKKLDLNGDRRHQEYQDVIFVKEPNPKNLRKALKDLLFRLFETEGLIRSDEKELEETTIRLHETLNTFESLQIGSVEWHQTFNSIESYALSIRQYSNSRDKYISEKHEIKQKIMKLYEDYKTVVEDINVAEYNAVSSW